MLRLPVTVAAACAATFACALATGWPAQAALAGPQSAAAGSASVTPVAPASAIAAASAVHAARVVPVRPAGVQARGGELVNATTGRWLWSRGLNVRRPMASITKVMAALVVIRAGRLQRKIKISAAVVAYVRDHDASNAGLHAGDTLTARQLLAALLLPSGCDAAFALARAYGPGWRAFVRKMNRAAKRLGMTATHFANFDGLPWPTEHSTYSTPRDLIRLGRAAMRLPTFRNIVRQRSHSIGATAQHHRYHWRSTNLLLGHYRGLVGIKTGSTDAAGYCLLFEARRSRRTLIGVVLDSSSVDPKTRFSDASRILDWGFRAARTAAGAVLGARMSSATARRLGDRVRTGGHRH